MGMFSFFSMNSSQQSMQTELNANMLAALQKQLGTTTWPTARNQLIAQINQLQANPQPQPQAPSPALSQAPSQSIQQQAPQPPLRRQQIEAELAIIKTSIARIEQYLAK